MSQPTVPTWTYRAIFTLSLLAVIAPGAVLAQVPLAINTQVPLAPKAIPKFVQPLPLLDAQGGPIVTTGGTSLTLTMCEFQSNILPPGTLAPGVQTSTWTWGYAVGGGCPATTRETYLGPVVIATRNVPTEITWVNNLGNSATTNVLAYKFSTDQTLHWANPSKLDCMNMAMGGPAFGSPCSFNYVGPIPAIPHLHGGEVPPNIDGGPDAWFTSDGALKGPKYYTKVVPGMPPNSAIFTYPNTQEAGPLWFHDHTLGATRLNVYAGLAGGYLLTDPALTLPANLQGVGEIVPLILQDRMFDTNGQLFFPADSYGGFLWTLNPDHPYWVPEFVGDTIVVNGKAWPFMSVQPKRYRFLFLNGSNARTYELFLINQATGTFGPPMWVIGNDGGYLDSPQVIDPALGGKLLIQPGERYEVIIDFAAFPNSQLLMRNTGRTPYPRGAAPQGSTLGQIVQFRVGAPLAVADASYNPALGGAIRQPAQAIVRLVNPLTGAIVAPPAKVRQLTLNEVMGMPVTAINPVTGLLTAYPGGPLEILVNNTKWVGTHMMNGMTMTRPDFTEIIGGGQSIWFSELPKEGDTELWEIVNLTADAHPIHLHLVQFQLLNRQGFDAKGYTAAYNLAFPGGLFMPGYGPPLAYDTGAIRLVGAAPVPLIGGNPDSSLYLQGPPRLAAPQETGWKDTVMSPPGSVTRFLVRWAPTSLPVATPAALAFFPFDPNDGGQTNYVWHCHIIDHEDNEMMRPTSVQLNPLAPIPSARPLVKGVSY